MYQTGNSEINFAVSELKYFFNEATGIELSDTEYSSGNLNPSDKYIVIGQTPAKNNGLTTMSLTSKTGYGIVSYGKLLYVYGDTVHGVINGVYGLMEKLFNLKVYYYDVFTIDKNVTNLTIDACNQFTNDELDYTFAAYGEMRDTSNPTYGKAYRYRMGFTQDYDISAGGMHNALSIIPYETYGATHPEWFYEGTTSDGYHTGKQIVLSVENFAIGVGTLVSTVANSLYNTIISYPDRQYFGFTPMDIDIWPNSGNSLALYNTYGTNAAEYIIFMNTVADILETKLASANRVVNLYLLAYNKTLFAPDITLSGLTQAQKDAVILHNGTSVKLVPFIAPVESNFYLNFEDSRNTVNNGDTVAETIEKWYEISNGNKMAMWNYALDCDNFYIPLNTIDCMSANYNYALNHGVTIIFNQTQTNNKVATDWSRLKMYLQSCLAKDATVNITTEIDNFMTNYFGAGASAMTTLLNKINDYYDTLYSFSSKAGTLRGSAWVAASSCYSYWDNTPVTHWLSDPDYDASMLLEWMGYINSAKTAVASATNSTELTNRIDIESLSIRYLLLKVYNNTTYDASLTALNSAAQALGMTSFQE